MKNSRMHLSLKLVSILLITVFLTQSFSSVALAGQSGIFFNASSAKVLAGKYEYLKQDAEHKQKIIDNLTATTNQYGSLSKDYDAKIKGLEEDKATYMKKSDLLQNAYTDCRTDLQNVPSRTVWYSAGVITTLVLTVLSFIIIK